MTPSPNLAEQSLSESTTGSRPAPIAHGRRPVATGGNRRLHVAFDGRHLTAAVPREPAPRSLPSLVAGVLGPLQIRRANHILAPSAYARHEIIHLLGVPSSKVTATPLAVDALFLRPPHPAGERGALLRRLGVAPPYL